MSILKQFSCSYGDRKNRDVRSLGLKKNPWVKFPGAFRRHEDRTRSVVLPDLVPPASAGCGRRPRHPGTFPFGIPYAGKSSRLLYAGWRFLRFQAQKNRFSNGWSTSASHLCPMAGIVLCLWFDLRLKSVECLRSLLVQLLFCRNLLENRNWHRFGLYFQFTKRAPCFCPEPVSSNRPGAQAAASAKTACTHSRTRDGSCWNSCYFVWITILPPPSSVASSPPSSAPG